MARAVRCPDDRALLYKFIGLFLTGTNEVQKILLLRGPARGGKGTLVKVIQALVGRPNYGELRTHLLLERFEIGRLYNVSLAIGADVPANFLSCDGAQRLKALTGGDEITCEVKGGNSVLHFTGNKFVVATANNTMTVRLEGEDDESAWRRRLVVVDFEPPSPSQKTIEGFGEKLAKEEASGILNLAIRGLQEHLRECREESFSGSVCLSEEQAIKTEALLLESKSVEVFVRSEIELIPEDELRALPKPKRGQIGLTSEDLLTTYGQYCARRSWRPMQTRAFYIQLAQEMLEQFNVAKSNLIHTEGTQTLRGYPNVRFIDHSQDPLRPF